ncbi:hypothetical protein BH20CHL4_BH20CHL4_13120 [soil metagenome]
MAKLQSLGGLAYGVRWRVLGHGFATTPMGRCDLGSLAIYGVRSWVLDSGSATMLRG